VGTLPLAPFLESRRSRMSVEVASFQNVDPEEMDGHLKARGDDAFGDLQLRLWLSIMRGMAADSDEPSVWRAIRSQFPPGGTTYAVVCREGRHGASWSTYAPWEAPTEQEALRRVFALQAEQRDCRCWEPFAAQYGVAAA
jgi:hypothetical protein